MATSSARYHISEDGKPRICRATVRECTFTIHGTKRALEAIEADFAAQAAGGSNKLSKGSTGSASNVNADRLADKNPLTKYLPNDRMSRSDVESIPLDSIPNTVPATYDYSIAANRLNSGEMNEYVAAIDFALGDDVEWRTSGDEAEEAYGVEIAGSKMYRRGDWLVIDKNGIITKTPVSAVQAARQQFVEDQAMDLQTAHARANAKNKARSKDIDIREEDLPARSKSYEGFAKLAALTRAACKSDVKQATTADDASKADIRVYLDDGGESAISWKSYVNDGTPSYATASNATEMGLKLTLDVDAARQHLEFLLDRQKDKIARLAADMDDPSTAAKITACLEQAGEYDRSLKLLAADPARFEDEAWARAIEQGRRSTSGETEGKATIKALTSEGFRPVFGSAKLVGKTYSRTGDPKASSASENVGKNWAAAAGVSEQEAVSAMAEVGWNVAGGTASAHDVSPVARTVISREIVDLNPTMEHWTPTVGDDGVIYMGDSLSVRENMEDGWTTNEYGGKVQKYSKKKELTEIRQVVQSYDGLADLWENRLADGISFAEADHPATGRAKSMVEIHSHDDLSGKPGFEEGHWLSVNFDVKSRRPKNSQQSGVGVREERRDR